MEVQFPWNIREENRDADRWRWAYGYLTNRGIDISSDFYLQPSTSTPLEDQARRMVMYSQCSRNWVTFLCESPTYMRTLFGYTMVSYVFTTQNRAIVVDAEDLIQCVDEPEGDLRDLIEHVDLLMICHIEPDHVQFKWKKSSVANILQRRKIRKLSTFLEIFVPNLADPLPEKARISHCMKMVDSFGVHAYELFTGSRAKNVIVRHRRVSNGITADCVGRQKAASNN